MMTTVTDDCIGCGLCAGSCPAVFQMNAEGRAEVMVPAVPEDLEREENIIHRHMFPLTPMPPTTREAWIVCLADKYCAAAETVEPVKKSRLFRTFAACCRIS